VHDIEKVIILDNDSPIYSYALTDENFELKIGNELQRYIFNCGKTLTSITNSIEKAKMSLSLLTVESIENAGLEGTAASKYIELLIENSIVRVQSIYDRVLIFTSRIFDLGISNDSMSHNLIVTNEHVVSHNLDTYLKSINKACNDYRFIRNKVIHHDRYTEEHLDNLTLLINANHLAEQAGKDLIVEPEQLRFITEAYLQNKSSELHAYLKNIETALDAFYDHVVPIYNFQKKRFDGK
jgi:hypothetical protein